MDHVCHSCYFCVSQENVTIYNNTKGIDYLSVCEVSDAGCGELCSVPSCYPNTNKQRRTLELISTRRRGGGRAEHAECPESWKVKGLVLFKPTTAQLRTEQKQSRVRDSCELASLELYIVVVTFFSPLPRTSLPHCAQSITSRNRSGSATVWRWDLHGRSWKTFADFKVEFCRHSY